MSKTNTFKKFFVFIVAMVMLTSPVLLAGCSLFGGTNINQTTPTYPSTPSGGGGSPSGGGNNEGSNTDNIFDPPEENAIDIDDYANYFKNYRITYMPGDGADRSNFNETLKTQNQNVADSFIDKLFNEYGESAVKFDGAIDSIEVNNNYLVYAYGSNYSFVSLGLNNRSFSHRNAINNDSLDDINNVIKWNWNEDEENFDSQTNKNKLQLAIYLILSGETLNEDGTGSFVDAYKQYFTDVYLTAIKEDFLTEDGDDCILNLDALSDVISKIDHLGFDEGDQASLKNFVLNYIIGKELVQTDNSRFVNAYSTDGENLTIIYNANSNNPNTKIGKIGNINYNRFLTDENYATGELNGDELTFTITGENKNLEGICYYAGKYLMVSSLNRTFLLNEDSIRGPLSSSRLSIQLVDDGALFDVTTAVYDALINTYGSAVDENSNKKFNANVWNYDANGNANSADREDTVQIKVGSQTYSLFSIRLPYFKNYYNTVNFMVDKMFGKLDTTTKAELDAQWQESKGMNYPYDTQYPNVPFSYFADYDNDDILFNVESGLIEMFSGYMAYQTLVVMPIQPLYIKEAAMFFIRQPLEGETDMDGTGDFDLTVYARYYDAETKSYATWGDDNSEFYYIDTVTMVYEEDLDKDTGIGVFTPIYLQLDMKDILTTAKINGAERTTYLISPAAEDAEVFIHEENLISVDNYGWWFNKVQTPLDDAVVCYDGVGANAESYIEFVFANPDGRDFQFCFYPIDCYTE